MLSLATDPAAYLRGGDSGAVEECCAPSTSGSLALPLGPRPRPLRKCVSTPTLHALCTPEGEGLEVYVVTRCFTEFGGGLFRKLPAPVRRGVRDSGLCHYMTVFKAPDGSMVQFDFGPKGGDIHVARGPLARLLSKNRGPGQSRIAVGEVRENQLSALPSAHMYVGRTNLSMDDIRAWNDMHRREYELHVNDCRHYVNSLVKYTTGMESAASSCLRHQWVSNREKYGLAHRIVRLGQIITDVSNWQRVKAVTQASVATVMALATRGTFSKLAAAPLVQSMRHRLVPVAARQANRLLPVARTGMVKAVVQKPVYAVGTAAVATCAATGGPVPLVRETMTVGSRIAGGMKTAVRAASLATARLAEHVGKRASLASRHTTEQAVAIVSGVAGAATRGAVTMTRPAGAGAAAAGARAGIAGPGSPMRITLPKFNTERAQRLALVATRR